MPTSLSKLATIRAVKRIRINKHLLIEMLSIQMAG